MKVKGIIFDLDGVLCRTDEEHFKAWKALAEHIGVSDFTREDNARQRGVSRMESLEVVLAKSAKSYTEAEKLRLAEYKNDIYKEMLKSMTPADLDPDVMRALDALKKSGIKVAVGSSSKNTPTILSRLGLCGFFDAVADGNDITRSKPDPEVFLLAAKRLTLEPRECLVVEDALSGVEAGHAGGFKVAAVGEAAKLGVADYDMEKLSDLIKLVL